MTQRVLDEMQSLWRKIARRLTRRDPDATSYVARLRPEGQSRGAALHCFSLPSTLHPRPTPLDNFHTVTWESLAMIEVLVELGYEVDAISYNNTSFAPQKRYDLFVGVMEAFGRIAQQINADCVKVYHINYSHWLTNNLAQYQRLQQLKIRRGFALQPIKLVRPHKGIEYADCATSLGNEFTMDSYGFAGKPIYRLPISTTAQFPPLARDYSSCRRNFVWFGSKGLVHKGLDLVLDAFARRPEYTLTVCGPINEEPEFEAAYHKELYATPNIKTLGWMDVASPAFRQVLETSVAVVFPSCAEGGGGSVITCMHGGLIPIVTRESSVDVAADYGVVLAEASVEAVIAAVTDIVSRPADDLQAMSHRAREFALSRHTLEHFRQTYKCTIAEILARR